MDDWGGGMSAYYAADPVSAVMYARIMPCTNNNNISICIALRCSAVASEPPAEDQVTVNWQLQWVSQQMSF